MRIPLPALVGGALSFLLAGSAAAMYGPALPAMRAAFGTSPEAAGLITSTHFGGGIAYIAAVYALERRLAGRTLILLAALLLAVGSVAMAWAPAHLSVLAAAALIGAGMHGLSVTLSMLIASTYRARSAAMMNLIQGALGVGQVIGPVMLWGWGPQRYRLPFALVGVTAALLLPLLWLLPRTRLSGAELPTSRPVAASRRLMLSSFVVVFVLFVGAEAGVAVWQATHLIGVGTSQRLAALSTGAFWGAVTVGRFGVIPLTTRLTPERIFVWSLGIAVIALLAATASSVAILAYVAVGLMVGPAFGTGLSWVGISLPDVRGAIPLVIAGGGVGGILFPPLIGRLVSLAGSDAIPLALAAIAAAALALAMLLRRGMLA